MNPDIDEPVELAAYDPRWPESFATDAADIQRKLASNVLQVEHFGSTAVPGALDKPFIDILVAPRDWPPANQQQALADGACTLMRYSAAKAADLQALLAAARRGHPEARAEMGHSKTIAARDRPKVPERRRGARELR